MMRTSSWVATIFYCLTLAAVRTAEAKQYFAYTSTSPTSGSAYWVAQEAGLFKKHGLDLDLILIDGSTRAIQSLIAGEISFLSGAGNGVINGKLAGGDIAIVNSLTNTLPYFVFGKPDIKSPEDLKGRTAAMHIPGTAADFALRLALNSVGLSLKDIKGVTVGGAPARVAAVTSGHLDFTVGTEGEKIRGEQFGLKVVIDMAKLNIPFQFTCTITTRRIIRENPTMVQRLVRAMAEAIHYYKNNKEPVVKIMQKYSRGPNRAFFEAAYKANARALVENTYPSIEGLRNTLDILATLDPKAAKAKPEDFVDLRFVDELRKSGFVEKLYGKR